MCVSSEAERTLPEKFLLHHVHFIYVNTAVAPFLPWNTPISKLPVLYKDSTHFCTIRVRGFDTNCSKLLLVAHSRVIYTSHVLKTRRTPSYPSSSFIKLQKHSIQCEASDKLSQYDEGAGRTTIILPFTKSLQSKPNPNSCSNSYDSYFLRDLR